MQTNSNGLALNMVDPATASGPVQDAFALLPDINLFRAMANAETLFPPFMRYLAELFKQLELDKALERMIVLRVVKTADCSYAWRQNVVVAHSVGVTAEQIAALERGDTTADCFSDAQKAAFAFADDVARNIEASETVTAAARRYFTDRAVTEMLFVVGTYMLVARIARTGRVPLDEKPAPSPQ